MKMIEINQLKKTISNSGNSFTILDSIHMEIHSGEFVSIMEPSGSGKSTLLNIIGGLDRQYEGQVRIMGHSLDDMGSQELLRFRRKNIGMVFQEFLLIQRISVKDNLKLPFLFDKRKVEGEQIDEILNMTGMYHKKDTVCSCLSGGEQQRAAIARACVLNPKLILADEPTGALDSENSVRIMELFQHLNETINTTIVLVTHDKNMASFGSRGFFLRDGKLHGM